VADAVTTVPRRQGNFKRTFYHFKIAVSCQKIALKIAKKLPKNCQNCVFLLPVLLILASQRIEVVIAEWFQVPIL
jgi:hypothetical protein